MYQSNCGGLVNTKREITGKTQFFEFLKIIDLSNIQNDSDINLNFYLKLSSWFKFFKGYLISTGSSLDE